MVGVLTDSVSVGGLRRTLPISEFTRRKKNDDQTERLDSSSKPEAVEISKN